MPFEECGSCKGKGFIKVARQRVVTENGKKKTITEWVTEDCRACRGSGVIAK